MATMRTKGEIKQIVETCLEIEKKGGDVLAYLATENYVSPGATWRNMQKEYLQRTGTQIRSGKPKGEPAEAKAERIKRNRVREIAEAYQEGRDIRQTLYEMGFRDIRSQGQTYRQLRRFAEEWEPEIAEIIPEKLPEPKKKSGNKLSKVEMIDKVPPIKADAIMKAVNSEKKPVITLPIQYDDFTVRAIEGKFGRYHYTEGSTGNYIDFNSKMAEMSMTVQEWREWLEELKHAAAVLGVEL